MSENERKLFRRLAVFRGGWTLESAQSSAGVKALEPGCLDGLESLIDQSLLRPLWGRDAREPEQYRYDMLETIRGYALEQLAASGEEHQIRRRHALCYLDLAEAATPSFSVLDRSHG